MATARTVEEERLRNAVEGAEEERRRWARELHDDTLQGLGALRLMLSSGRRDPDQARLRVVVDDVVEQLDHEIAGLRSLIRELRPAALDELGPGPAFEDLAQRVAARHGIEVATAVDASVAAARHAPEVELVLYRTAQEALTNVVKHADAGRAEVRIAETAGALVLEVADDGSGFDPDASTSGFGLTGMRERAALLGGELEVRSSPDGSVVRAVLPLRRDS